MQTVESLIRELQKFPADAQCYAYEGESVTAHDGRQYSAYIVVRSPDVRRELGYVPCDSTAEADAGAIINA